MTDEIDDLPSCCRKALNYLDMRGRRIASGSDRMGCAEILGSAGLVRWDDGRDGYVITDAGRERLEWYRAIQARAQRKRQERAAAVEREVKVV